MRYATLEDLQLSIEQENKERPSYNLQRRIDPVYQEALTFAESQDDKNLIMQISEGEAYLSDKDKASLWTVTNPSQLSEILASAREKAMGGDVCKNRKKNFDKYGRPADINSLDYYVCPGDDPLIYIDRQNYVDRLAYDKYPVYPYKIPAGLTTQNTVISPISELFPPSIPLINMAEVSVPYGLTTMRSEYFKKIPQGLNM